MQGRREAYKDNCDWQQNEKDEYSQLPRRVMRGGCLQAHDVVESLRQDLASAVHLSPLRVAPPGWQCVVG